MIFGWFVMVCGGWMTVKVCWMTVKVCWMVAWVSYMVAGVCYMMAWADFALIPYRQMRENVNCDKFSLESNVGYNRVYIHTKVKLKVN